MTPSSLGKFLQLNEKVPRMDDTRQILDQLLEERGFDYATISRLLGRNPAYIQQYIKRGSPKALSERDRRLIAEFLGVDETILGASPRANDNRLVSVPVLHVEASAGFGAIAENEDRTRCFGFDKNWLKKHTGGRRGRLSIVCVRGDSMEPTLCNGDEVLVDASDAVQRIRDGIYVLKMDRMLVVKRIAVKPGSRVLSVKSDNSAYPSWDDIDRADLEIIGRVIWISRTL